MRDRDPNLADFAACEKMVAVETGLGRQVERDRKACLSLGQVLPIEAIGFARGRMTGICAEDPGLVPTRRSRLFAGHDSPAFGASGGVVAARARSFVHGTITENIVRRHTP